MALFTIADLHLPGKEGKNKSMEIFGSRWIGGVEKLIYNWNAVVKPEDTVVLPGDISWAMMLEETKEDFESLIFEFLYNKMPTVNGLRGSAFIDITVKADGTPEAVVTQSLNPKVDNVALEFVNMRCQQSVMVYV